MESNATIPAAIVDGHVLFGFQDSASCTHLNDAEFLEDMALTEKDKEFFAKEIRATIAAKPTGLGKLKEYLPLGTALAIFLGLLTLAGEGWYYANSKVATEAEFRGKANAALTGIDRTLTDIEKRLSAVELSQRATSAAARPKDKANQREVAAVIADALSKSITLPTATLQQVGQSFGVAAGTDPGAWSTVLDVLKYRAGLNAAIVPGLPNPQPSPPGADFVVGLRYSVLPGAPEIPVQFFYPASEGFVPGFQSAIFVRIGRESAVVNGPTKLVLEGKGLDVSLDGYHLRHVVIRDATISYYGGPLVLEDVSFVNCTFDLKYTPKTLQFADSVLARVPSSFTG